MTVVGFTLDKNDKTKRIPCEYNSHDERAWCETAELADAELWVEADEKLTEYYDLCGGFINSSRDATLTAKVAVGLAKTTLQPNHLIGALQATSFAIGKDGGCDIDLFSNLLWGIAQAHVQKNIPAQVKDEDDDSYDGYTANWKRATTPSLVTVANELLKIFRLVQEQDMDMAHYNDNVHETMWEIVDELLTRKDASKQTRALVEKLLQLDVYDYFSGVAGDSWKPKLQL